MSKAQRQARILEIIRRKPVHSQKKLAAELAREGFRAGQVTLSRDLRELGLVKTPAGYREPSAAENHADADRLRRVVQQLVQRIETAQNLVVVKTLPGGAGPVAVALDAQQWDDVVGTVAGDDTIFVAARSVSQAAVVERRLRELW